MNEWLHCRKILCVRADNIGDVLMSGAAMQALKNSFNAHITLLTSAQGSLVASMIPAIDEVITADFPWVKFDDPIAGDAFLQLIEILKEREFDGAVIFSVYSQSVLPAALMLTLAGISLRLAYCRENPYQLLTSWVPDPEPYSIIRHQVRRDLDLVKFIGATIDEDSPTLIIPEGAKLHSQQVLRENGVDVLKPYIVMHTGVSESKREYPTGEWRRVIDALAFRGYQVLLTGSNTEREKIGQRFCPANNVFLVAGLLSLPQFASVLESAALVITVNTSAAHIGAALNAKLLVLYALTNPQHLPWKARGAALFFDVPSSQRSRNEIIRYVTESLMMPAALPAADVVISKALDLLSDTDAEMIPEMAPLIPHRQ